MSDIIVKICGLTNINDALSAYRLGADYLGFIGVPNTPRFVSPDEFRTIVSALPSDAKPVIVVDNPADSQKYGAQRVQYYQLDADVSHLDAMLWPVLRPNGQDDDLQNQLQKLPESAEFVIIDAYSPDKLGGSGRAFDARLSQKAAAALEGRLILAGGLTPETVADAVKLVKPRGVDVSSGVEEKLRVKSIEKLIAFIREAKK